ncbi:hypothetical protein [Ilumatobacter sp.]|uniref:hypothetical protein n=1 Tax=Ilumatobacter sp. TaxID=1967498 RepID=UPI003C444D1D
MTTPTDPSSEQPIQQPTRPRFGLDRRMFLVGTASAGFLAACGGGSSEGDAAADGDGSGGSDDGGEATTSIDSYAIVQRFPSDVLVPGEIRLPFSLALAAEFISDGPDELTAQVVDLEGNDVGDEIVAVRRDVTPSSYYAFRPTIDTPGIYAIRIEGGPEEGANFQVMEPDQVAVPGPGDTLPAFATPTPDDPGGVDPICTREPACPFHEVTLTDALASGKSVAYIVGTPAFCQTGTCAPALETMVSIAPEYTDDYVFVHAEVWDDLTATEVAPAVADLNMQFEPALFIVDPTGSVVERIDGLWDATELRERLDDAIA